MIFTSYKLLEVMTLF